ncbi:MAG: hypothetical protein EPN85_01030 [Bacteroidetes bacterium]|nr:MAG: hypothetical protein EPN85_01030 [Bacteroidota bacterium]
MSILKWRLVCVLITPGVALAGGFQLNVQGQKALSMGEAGTALSKDASVLFFNPGGVSLLRNKFNFTAGTSIIIPNISLQTEAVANTNQTSPIGTPIQFYATAKLNEKASLGFAVNNQFGSTSSFDKDWEGKFIVQKLALKTFMYQPTFSYNINSRIGVGAGFVYTSGSFEFEKAVPVATAQYDNGQASLKGNGTGFSYNAGIQGILLKPDTTKWVSSLKAGFSYRSPIKLSLINGTAAFTDISVALQDQFPAQTSFNAQLTLPGVYSLGLQSNIRINEKINIDVVIDYNRTMWSSYDSLKIDFSNAETPDSKIAKNWKDVSTFRIGAGINYNKILSIRLGAYYDQTPVRDGYVSPELPDNTNIAFTAGVGIELMENLSVDISWLVSDFKRTASLEDAGFSATYHRNVNVIGFGLNYTIK